MTNKETAARWVPVAVTVTALIASYAVWFGGVETKTESTREALSQHVVTEGHPELARSVAALDTHVLYIREGIADLKGNQLHIRQDVKELMDYLRAQQAGNHRAVLYVPKIASAATVADKRRQESDQ